MRGIHVDVPSVHVAFHTCDNEDLYYAGPRIRMHAKLSHTNLEAVPYGARSILKDTCRRILYLDVSGLDREKLRANEEPRTGVLSKDDGKMRPSSIGRFTMSIELL